MYRARIGDRVRVQCTRIKKSPPASPDTGKEFEFTVGSHAVLRGLSLGVVGMAQGDHKQLRLRPKEAYGPVKENLIREVRRTRLPPQLALQVGQRLTARQRATGRRHIVRIIQVKPSSVIVDGNHPLAGKTITMEILVISVDGSSNANQSQPQFDVGGES
ncbi:MAG TPA: FKBP-type peptidyl-prolyl cis-trans isomerase [Pirellulaceae bacterium]|nr:FKBP-type peptidyl-prolyl cis-trans isomerase [Pirellulaceae bacterium]